MTNTSQSMFIQANEVRELLGVSRAYAYKIVKQLNEELEAKGFLVIPGRTSRQYFNEHLYSKAV